MTWPQLSVYKIGICQTGQASLMVVLREVLSRETCLRVCAIIFLAKHK